MFASGRLQRSYVTASKQQLGAYTIQQPSVREGLAQF